MDLVVSRPVVVEAGGECCPLARRGDSRDGKRGKLQIVFGLLQVDSCISSIFRLDYPN